MNAEICYSPASQKDFPAILELQGKNLFEALTQEQRASGFLTGEFSFPMLQELVDGGVIVKAFTRTELVGYRMAQTLAFASRTPLLAAVIHRFPKIVFKGKTLSEADVFFSGPTCISEAWRGRGIYEEMFKQMLSLVQNQFEIGVAFIDEANHRSLAAAQRKLRMQVVDQLAFDGKCFSILAFSTRPAGQGVEVSLESR